MWHIDFETDDLSNRRDPVVVYVCREDPPRMDPVYIEDRPRHSGPRSIRETMRRNRPSKRRGR